VLYVSHLCPPRSFCVGEDPGCDFLLPADRLGTSRWPIVKADGTSLALLIPPSACGHVELPGEPRISLDEARQEGQPSELAGGLHFCLTADARARIEFDRFVFLVRLRMREARAIVLVRSRTGLSSDTSEDLARSRRVDDVAGVVTSSARTDERRGRQARSDVSHATISRRGVRARAGAETEERERDSPTYERESATTRYRRSFQQLLDDLDWRITYEASCITWPVRAAGVLQEDLSEWRVVRSDDFDEVRAGDLSLSGSAKATGSEAGRGAAARLAGFLRSAYCTGPSPCESASST